MASTRTATDTMKAFVNKGVGEVAVVEKPVPEPKLNQVVVSTTAALVYTSDIHTVQGAIPVDPNSTLGRESVCVVHSLGSAVEGFSEGDRVAVGAITPCLKCNYCQRGFSGQCQGMLGGYKFTTQMDGNIAQYFLVEDAQANLAHIPDDLSDHMAVYATDMLSTGFMGAEHAELGIGETVAVFAQGAVGLSATIACRLLGAGIIITVEAVPERQEVARQFSADEIVDFTKGDSVEQILELIGGEGGGRRHRGVRIPPDLGRRDKGYQARRAHRQHWLPRREPGAPGGPARAVRKQHGRQANLRRPVPRRQRAAAPYLPAHADW